MAFWKCLCFPPALQATISPLLSQLIHIQLPPFSQNCLTSSISYCLLACFSNPCGFIFYNFTVFLKHSQKHIFDAPGLTKSLPVLDTHAWLTLPLCIVYCSSNKPHSFWSPYLCFWMFFSSPFHPLRLILSIISIF
jgi:hypothetical protein